MPESEFLSSDELRELTDASRAGKQAAWLEENHVPYRHVGTRVLVSRMHIRAWLEGRAIVTSKGPNWAAMA